MRGGSVGLVVGGLLGLLLVLPLATAASATPSIAGTQTGPGFYQINPPRNEWPAVRSTADCWTYGFYSKTIATSKACATVYVNSFDAARAKEHVGPLILPSNWDKLSNERQQFVLIDLERTARGESPLVGIMAELSSAAETGADQGHDPALVGAELAGFNRKYGEGVSVPFGYWDASTGSPFLPLWIMLYADACGPTTIPGSGNGACGPHNEGSPKAPPSWGHRDGILLHSTYSGCNDSTPPDRVPCLSYIGTGYGPQGIAGVIATGKWGSSPNWSRPPTTFTWASELEYLPPCERHGDACTTKSVASAQESATRLATTPAISVEARYTSTLTWENSSGCTSLVHAQSQTGPSRYEGDHSGVQSPVENLSRPFLGFLFPNSVCPARGPEISRERSA